MSEDQADVTTDPETQEAAETIELQISADIHDKLDAYAAHAAISQTDAVRRIVRRHFLQSERRIIRLAAFTAGLTWVLVILLLNSQNLASIVGAIYIVATLFWASYPLMRST